MPSFADSAVIFVLALLLFGPKKLPVLARELGKWIGEFRRASNEFKMQMEEELRLSEQADRQKELAAIEAAAPAPPALEGIPTEDPEHPHIERYELPQDVAAEPHTGEPAYIASDAQTHEHVTEGGLEPLPIATSGDLHMMPPATGLPVARTSNTASAASDLGPLIESIPVADTTPHADAETSTHG